LTAHDSPILEGPPKVVTSRLAYSETERGTQVNGFSNRTVPSVDVFRES